MGGSVPPPVSGPPPPAAAPAAAPALAEVTVAKVPERLASLPRAVVVSGTVAGETPEGLTRVRTQAGEVLVKSPLPLPADKPVTLQIAAGQPPGRAVLFSAPAGTAAPPPSGTGLAPSVVLNLLSSALSAGTPTQPPAPTLVPGALLPAVVLAAARPPAAPAPALAPTVPAASSPAAPPAGGAPAPAGAALPGPAPGAPVPLPSPAAAQPPALAGALPPTPPGASAAVLPGAPTVLPSPSTGGASAPPPVPLPAAGPVATAPASQPAAAAGVAPALPTPSPAPTTSPAAGPAAAAPAAAPPPFPPLTQGATVALRVLTVVPPGAAALPEPAAPSGTAAEPTVSGTVAGRTPQGQPILATERGMLALNTRAVVPPGTRVTAAVSDPAAALAALPAEGEGAIPGRAWATLREAFALLAAVEPELARSVLGTVVPQPNRKLGAALSFFLAAVRGGSGRAWLGEEAASALDRAGHGDVLSRLDREFRGLRQQAAEPPPGDWRPYLVPMFDGQAMTPLQLHVRPLHDEEDAGGPREVGDRGSRFLIEVELSRLGPLQLDGMVRDRRFDLILRSRTALPAELRGELLGVFSDCLEAVGYGGGLSFQAGARGWVTLARAGRPLGVTA
ncbi:hypothetical protein [Azospirillum sp. A39]|uniref:hypothetical protein n=1 Tax=Azospirillum sp. A39 TaxID=3462279 RepID=UPI0040462E7E